MPTIVYIIDPMLAFVVVCNGLRICEALPLAVNLPPSLSRSIFRQAMGRHHLANILLLLVAVDMKGLPINLLCVTISLTKLLGLEALINVITGQSS